MAKGLCLPDVTKNDVETRHSTMESFAMKEYSAQESLPSASGLGESPLYRSSDKTFLFVDIKSRKSRLAHKVPESEGWAERNIYEFDQPITRLEAVAKCMDVLAVQTRFGLALLSLQTGALKDIVTLQHERAWTQRCE